jgi:hypothetical protein
MVKLSPTTWPFTSYLGSNHNGVEKLVTHDIMKQGFVNVKLVCESVVNNLIFEFKKQFPKHGVMAFFKKKYPWYWAPRLWKLKKNSIRP